MNKRIHEMYLITVGEKHKLFYNFVDTNRINEPCLEHMNYNFKTPQDALKNMINPLYGGEKVNTSEISIEYIDKSNIDTVIKLYEEKYKILLENEVSLDNPEYSDYKRFLNDKTELEIDLELLKEYKKNLDYSNVNSYIPYISHTNISSEVINKLENNDILNAYSRYCDLMKATLKNTKNPDDIHFAKSDFRSDFAKYDAINISNSYFSTEQLKEICIFGRKLDCAKEDFILNLYSLVDNEKVSIPMKDILKKAYEFSYGRIKELSEYEYKAFCRKNKDIELLDNIQILFAKNENEKDKGVEISFKLPNELVEKINNRYEERNKSLSERKEHENNIIYEKEV